MPGTPVPRYSALLRAAGGRNNGALIGMVGWSHRKHVLLQAVYQRLFEWVVDRINGIMEPRGRDPRRDGKDTVIGVLDIYGFEVFPVNR